MNTTDKNTSIDSVTAPSASGDNRRQAFIAFTLAEVNRAVRRGQSITFRLNPETDRITTSISDDSNHVINRHGDTDHVIYTHTPWMGKFARKAELVEQVKENLECKTWGEWTI